MSRVSKIVLAILLIVIALLIGFYLLIGAIWTGAFNFLFPKEIGTYESPDGEYTLVFEQLGDPAWPFGPTDVRLTLKNRTGKPLEKLSTQVHNDGGNAGEDNIRSIDWAYDKVIVVLGGAEMEDREIILPYD